jgi:ADP-dependent NAD(P)H-hydrate dehydratase / NAD(P)H-hydrate epimerase
MPVPILTFAQMRAWENATWATGIAEKAVIERVGFLIAQRLLQLTRPGERILLLAGKGHNGDDACAALPHLESRRVRLINVRDPEADRGELCAALVEKPAWIVDGLFGIGLNRPLDEAWTGLITILNESRIPLLAIDVPSGLNAETGHPQNSAVKASLTLTVGAPKTGLVRPQAAPWVGRLEVLPDIGLVPCPQTSEMQWTLTEDFVHFPPPRDVLGHKGSYGHVFILAGSLGYHGAAVLAGRGALRAQPGLVTICTQPDVYQPVAAQAQAAMVHPWIPDQNLPEKCTAIVVGPGLADSKIPEEFRRWVARLWEESPLAVVADASALAWLPKGETGGIRVITPHPGEAARLLGTSAKAVQEDRIGSLRQLSSDYGNCMVVLKGHQTLIGRASGHSYHNSSGNPWLGQGGSGDVLAGFLGGLLAQPELARTPIDTVRYGVWEHGAAADRLMFSGRRWTVEDLLDELGSPSSQAPRS